MRKDSTVPQISCIIPVYKAEGTIGRCLDSLVVAAKSAGLTNDLQIICVDDGSPDASASLIAQKQQESSVEIVLLRFENAGSWKARWRGVDAALGEYLCFVDADDYVDKNYFADFLAHLTSGVDVVVCGLRRVVEEDGRCLSTELDEPKPSFSIQESPELLLEINTGLMNKLMCADLVKRSPRMTATSPFLEDGALMQLVYAQAQGKLCFTGTCTYNYMVHENSQITSLKEDVTAQIFTFMEELVAQIRALGASDRYMDQLAALLFCHLAISLPHRMPKDAVGRVCKEVRSFLDGVVPTWRRNPYLTLSFACAHKGKFPLLALAHLLFVTHLMEPALAVYGWLISVSKHEIKW